MSTDSVAQGLQEEQEIILLKSQITLDVPASTQEKEVTFAHNLGLTPYFDFMMSPDGGTTFYGPYTFLSLNGNSFTFIQMYTDEVLAHFIYTYSSAPPYPSARSFVIDFKLYITETTR